LGPTSLVEKNGPRVLIVDHGEGRAALLKAELEARGNEVAIQSAGALAASALADAAASLDVVVTDVSGDAAGAQSVVRQAHAADPSLPVVLLAPPQVRAAAVDAVRAGAFDFVSPVTDVEALLLALDRAVAHRRLGRELSRLRNTVELGARHPGLLGRSHGMQELLRVLDRVADSEATVLVTGEPGTGKEQVARALHRGGRRAAGPFVALSCSAIPPELLERELFGQVKGAFPDASSDRLGALREARGGTLFLDDVQALPAELQPKLLRVLKERKVLPVGAEREVSLDVRVVSAASPEAVASRQLREDLYYRLGVVQLSLPPLRERGTDVLLLAASMLELHARAAGKVSKGFSEAATARLLSYQWPGNVCELDTCVEFAVALTRGERIEVEDLPEKLRSTPPASGAAASPVEGWLPMDEVERRYIQAVLEHVKGNKRRAAALLGFDRTTLYRKLGRDAALAAHRQGLRLDAPAQK